MMVLLQSATQTDPGGFDLSILFRTLSEISGWALARVPYLIIGTIVLITFLVAGRIVKRILLAAGKRIRGVIRQFQYLFLDRIPAYRCSGS